LQGEWATAWINTNYGNPNSWFPLTNVNLANIYDCRRSNALNGIHPMIVMNCQGYSSVAAMGPVTAGIFGGTGIQNPNWVKYDDGSPILYNGHAYFVATVGGMSTNAVLTQDGIPSSHTGIFEVDIGTLKLTQIGAVFVARTSTNLGIGTYGDLVISAMFDTTQQAWRLIADTWGDASNNIMTTMETATTQQDPLHGVHVYTNFTSIFTPYSNHHTNSCWEGDVYLSNGVYYITYAQSNTNDGFGTFCPAVISTTDWQNYTGVQSNGTATAREGERWVNFGGTNYYACSTTTDCQLFSMATGATAGTFITWNQYISSQALGIAPHCAFTWFPDGYGNSRGLMLTFDSQQLGNPGVGWWSHGDHYFFQNKTNQNGYVFGTLRKWLGF
jgi:hypothetical protein